MPYNGPAGVGILEDEFLPLSDLLHANPRPWNRRLREELFLRIAERKLGPPEQMQLGEDVEQSSNG